jgi:preprotein translocase subunit SecE
MAVETKKMANSIMAPGSIGNQIKSWPEKIRSFYSEVRNEMRKVTWPGMREVRSTTAVVIITVFIFALYFGIIDFIIQHGVAALFRAFRARY